MNWLREVFGKEKVVIGMVHIPPMPGAPRYDERAGIPGLIERVERDVQSLQEGQIDAIMFCNEDDRPYVQTVGPETVATMTRIITSVLPKVQVPYGVDVLWDPIAAIAVANAVGASFVREVFTGAYAGDIGIWNTNCAAALRFRRQINADRIKLLYNINAEFAAPLAPRDLASVARSAVFSSLADAICVSGQMTGQEAATDALQIVKEAIGNVPVFANTGVNAANVAEKLAVADGAVVGTSLKQGGVTWNPVDPARVAELMNIVSQVRREAR